MKSISRIIPTRSILFKFRSFSTFYSKSHEWIKITDENSRKCRIGITNYAQDSLGEIVYADLPEVDDGSIDAGEVVATLESVKAVGEVKAPIGIEKIESVNEELTDSPGLLNSSPMEDGWIMDVIVNCSEDSIESALKEAELLSESEYQKYIEAAAVEE